MTDVKIGTLCGIPVMVMPKPKGNPKIPSSSSREAQLYAMAAERAK